MKMLAQKIELAFWDRVIPLLTESPLVRGSIQKGYAILAQQNAAVLSSLLLAGIACSGLLTGILLGKVILFLR